MNPQSLTDGDRRKYVLAEFRCALVKAKLAQYDIEAVALALKFNLVTAEQAVGMFWASETVHFLGLKLEANVDDVQPVQSAEAMPTGEASL